MSNLNGISLTKENSHLTNYLLLWSILSDDNVFDSSEDVLHTHTYTHTYTRLYTHTYTHSQKFEKNISQ